MFGFMLDERLGKWAFWFFNIGFYVCFMPQYALGLMGMTRRIYTYPAGLGWTVPNFISTIGAYMMGIGFLFIVWQVIYSIKYGERDVTGDPWDGRTLEWSLPSPAPHYNFATIPTIQGRDAWWMAKQGELDKKDFLPEKDDIKPIHMPKNSGRPFILSLSFFIIGLGLVFGVIPFDVIGGLGVAFCMFRRSFEYDTDYYVPVDEVVHTESALGRLQG